MKYGLKRPSPAMVVAGVALVSSFAGPAVAADVAQMAKKLTGKDIANSSITGKDIRNRSITGADIKDGTVAGRDLAPGSVGADQVLTDSIPGSDIKDGSLTGADLQADTITGREIAEGTVGKVPGAAQADDASALQGKVPADFVAAGRLITGKAEMKMGDAPETLVEFKGYKVTATCTDGGTGPVVKLLLNNVSGGTSAVQTWWSDADHPSTTDNEFENGEEMLVVEHDGTSYHNFKWEQYGVLNLFNPGNSTYMWGGATAVGVNLGDHDCVAVFRSLLA